MMHELNQVAGKKASRRAIRALKPQLRRLCLVTGPGALIADEAEVTFDDSRVTTNPHHVSNEVRTELRVIARRSPAHGKCRAESSCCDGIAPRRCETP